MRTTDETARVVLPKSFAIATVVVEQLSETEVRIRKATVIAEEELPFTEESVTRLSNRDRDLFLELLNKQLAPNRALKKAAERYKALRGRMDYRATDE